MGSWAVFFFVKCYVRKAQVLGAPRGTHLVRAPRHNHLSVGHCAAAGMAASALPYPPAPPDRRQCDPCFPRGELKGGGQGALKTRFFSLEKKTIEC